MTDSLEGKDSRAALFHKAHELDSSFCLSKVDTRDAVQSVVYRSSVPVFALLAKSERLHKVIET